MEQAQHAPSTPAPLIAPSPPQTPKFGLVGRKASITGSLSSSSGGGGGSPFSAAAFSIHTKFQRADSHAVRQARPDLSQPKLVMSATQSVSPQLPTERLAHRSRPSPVARLLSRAVETNAPRTAAREAAATSHARRPSQFHGHSILATSETLDGPARRKATPLDDVPALFPIAAMEQMKLERPYLEDVKTVVNTLQMITQESAIEKSTEGEGSASALAVTVPNVAAGWSGNRKQAVAETALSLANAVDKLLIDRVHSHHHTRTANPLANLRSEFLSSREILNLVHTHATSSSPDKLGDLAPALLALSKIYQNRLLEFQGMNAVRLEIEPQEEYAKRFEKVKEAQEEKKRKAAAAEKAAAAFIAAAAAKMAVHKQPPTDPEQKRLWATLKRKARTSVAFGAVPGGLLTKRRAPSIIVPPASAVAAVAAAAAAAVPSSSTSDGTPAVTEAKWRRLENQGSLEMYLPWNLLKRESHLFADEIVELTKIYWRACFMDEKGVVHTGVAKIDSAAADATSKVPKVFATSLSSSTSTSDPTGEFSEGGLLVGMPKRIYMHLYTLVHYVLKPSYLPSYAQQCVAQDWLIDIHMSERPKDASKVLMTLPQFHLGLFNLVDTWTEGVSLEEYVSFLKNLFEFITEEVKHASGAPAVSAPVVRTVSLLDSDSDEDSDTEITGDLPPAGANVSSVYHRRLRPLTIPHINALRKLGLRAPAFRELTREMLHDIEAKAKATAAQEAMAAKTKNSAILASSDSASSLALIQSAAHEEKHYVGPTLSANKRVALDEMRPNTRPSSPAYAGTKSPGGIESPRNYLRRRSLVSGSPSASGSPSTRSPSTRSPRDSMVGGGAMPLTPIMNREAAMAEAGVSPSWVKPRQPGPPGVKSVVAVPVSSIPKGSSSASSSVAHRRRPSLKPSKQQVSEEERKEATELEMNEAELQQLDDASAAATAEATPPTSPLTASGDVRTPKKRKPSYGKLSWRLPSHMTPDIAESHRLISAEFASMKIQHDAARAASSASKREKELLGANSAGQGLHALDEGEEEEDAEQAAQAAAAAKRRKKRRSGGKGSPRFGASGRRLYGHAGGSDQEEEKEGDDDSPDSPSRLSGRNTAAGMRPGSSPTGGRAKYQGRPAQSYERQRRQFALESADYLSKIDRLRKDAMYHTAAMQAAGIYLPMDQEDGRTTAQIIRDEFLPTFDPTVAALQRLRYSGPIALAEPPVPAYIRQPPSERSALSALDAPSPTIRPSSASATSSAAYHSGDRRDRIWRLQPQGRFGLVHDEVEPVIRTPQRAAARPSTARPASSSSRLSTARSSCARGPHLGGLSRYCDCFSCTELLAPTRAQNAAAFHAENMHRVIEREVQPDRAIDRLQALMERI